MGAGFLKIWRAPNVENRFLKGVWKSVKNYPGEGSHHICVYRHSCSVVKCSRRGEGITQTESETDD